MYLGPMLMDQSRLAGPIFLEVLLILLYPTLYANIQAIATAEGATSLEVATGVILPYALLFIIVVLAGWIVYEAFGKN